MTDLVGIRLPGSARINFVSLGDGIGALHPGDRVAIETSDGQQVATVAITPNQVIHSEAMPPIIGRLVRIDQASPDRSRQSSREDTAYRARKAAYPPLGSTARSGETVVRIDLRNAAIDLRDDAGETTTIPLADLPST
ncbi:MAG: hypothetical protein QM753_07010 [Thermomicrobiales bacterium]